MTIPKIIPGVPTPASNTTPAHLIPGVPTPAHFVRPILPGVPTPKNDHYINPMALVFAVMLLDQVSRNNQQEADSKTAKIINDVMQVFVDSQDPNGAVIVDKNGNFVGGSKIAYDLAKLKADIASGASTAAISQDQAQLQADSTAAGNGQSTANSNSQQFVTQGTNDSMQTQQIVQFLGVFLSVMSTNANILTSS